ncbi:hypothetical protein KC315_g18410, partial [Hortaea werneckii]
MSTETRVRTATLNRDTNETKIQLSLNLDGGALQPVTDQSNGSDDKTHAAQQSKSQQISVD